MTYLKTSLHSEVRLFDQMTVYYTDRSLHQAMLTYSKKIWMLYRNGRMTGLWNSIPRSARYYTLHLRKENQSLEPYVIHGHQLEEVESANVTYGLRYTQSDELEWFT